VAIKSGELATNKVFLDTINYAKQNKKPLHLLGLVSNGGVHSHINHIKAITSICKEQSLTNVFIHAFTDGRDTDPKSGLGFLKDLDNHLKNATGQMATVTGRYYAMDRDKRWERVKLAYDALVRSQGVQTSDILKEVQKSYEANITDEFIKPIINQNVQGAIQEGDAVLAFNFRTDRCREITEVLTQKAYPEFSMQPLSLYYTTMTEYDHTYKNVFVMYRKDDLKNTLGEIVAANHLKQIRMAETEKYPHVTFFFSGGREQPFEGEKRIMVPSPKVATYDLQPEMSAVELTDALLPELETASANFICINYANTDMVGHTGVWEAVIKAAETVDKCVSKVVTLAVKKGYTVVLTADHGNADYMINEDGSPNTAHTLNPVPVFIINDDKKVSVHAGKLADIAPTILTIMGIAIPQEMTGNILTA
jgi:2,3-bisphosphoglycerate-independent phosphoglycerate mutase